MKELLIDASSLVMLACERRYKLRVLLGKKTESSAEAEFGSRVHKFAELLAKHGRPEGDVAPCDRVHLEYRGGDSKLLLNACMELESHISRRQEPLVMLDLLPAVEVRFKFPFCVYDGIQVYLCGTLDRLELSQGNTITCVDWKTTRVYDLPKHLQRFTSSTQMLFYYYVLYQFGHYILPLEYANICRELRHRMQIVVIGLTKNPIRVQEGPPITFSLNQVLEFGEVLNHAVERIVNDIMNDTTPYGLPTGMLVNACPGCPYEAYCRGNLDGVETLEESPYDPMTHGL